MTSLDDDGSTGSHRWAITQANATAGADIIKFSGSVLGTSTLTSNLPSVPEALTINGPRQDDLIIVSEEGFGFLPDSDVDVWMFSSLRLLTTVSADALGRVNDDVVLPATIEEESHRFVLDGQNASGDDAVVGLGLIVGYETDGLSTTGKSLIALPIALAILAGLLILTALRRRRRPDDNTTSSPLATS